MNYDQRVKHAIKNNKEDELINLIQEEIEPTEENIKAKEAAIGGLAEIFVSSGRP